jgi:hypothetical protein
MILANTNDIVMIVNYDHNHSFIVLTTVIMIVNYNCKTFIVQATGLKSPHGSKYYKNFSHSTAVSRTCSHWHYRDSDTGAVDT